MKLREKAKVSLIFVKKSRLLTITVLLFLLCMTGCSKAKSYDVKITIPAGSTDTFVYSESEISPDGDSITLSCGKGLGDTEVILKPVNESEGSYLPVYLTQGAPAKVDTIKGEWFQVGVSVQNPTSEAIIVSVHAENVDIRIE